MAVKKTLEQKLIEVQKELKAPKNQTNKFGGYQYRSHEDILEAVKPLLHARGLLLYESDSIIEVGGRCFVQPTVTLVDADSKESISVTGAAEMPETKKGMDVAQITGASSSYARKYTLNGLFLIDDTKDADFTNKGGGSEGSPKQAAKPAPKRKSAEEVMRGAPNHIANAKDPEAAYQQIVSDYKDVLSEAQIKKLKPKKA